MINIKMIEMIIKEMIFIDKRMGIKRTIMKEEIIINNININE